MRYLDAHTVNLDEDFALVWTGGANRLVTRSIDKPRAIREARLLAAVIEDSLYAMCLTTAERKRPISANADPTS